MRPIIKVLYVHYGDNWIRGSEKCLLDLIESLDNLNYSPVIWTNNATLYNHTLLKKTERIFSSFPLLLGWRVPRFSITRWIKLVIQGVNIIHKSNIELIHVNSGGPCQWMWLVAKICNIPMITHLHCEYPLRDRLTLGLHLSPNIVTVSHAVSNSLLKKGYPNKQLTVIHNGFKTIPESEKESLCVRERLGIHPHAFTFITVGSLIQRKGVDKLITALKLIHKHNNSVQLIVVGAGPEHHKLVRLSEKLALSNSVHFVGEQKNVSAWLEGGVDAFISGANNEAFGLVLGEASQATLPIIAPNVGGIPEVVIDKHSALLYPSGNSNELVKAMLMVMNSPELRKTLGKNSKERIESTFSNQNYALKMQNIYSTLIGQPRNSSTFLSIISTFIVRLSKIQFSHK